MKFTEAYLIKLIKKYINKFMCCCVGSTIGEGEPEGLAREGAIYIDSGDDGVIYYYTGTEWLVASATPQQLWNTAGTIYGTTTADASINLTGDKTIKVANQQQFDDNAAALTALAEVGEHYTTPDGIVHTVLASVAPKLRTLIIKTTNNNYDLANYGDPIAFTIEANDYTGTNNISLTKEATVGRLDGLGISIDFNIVLFSGLVGDPTPDLDVFGNLSSPTTILISLRSTTNLLSTAVSMARNQIYYFTVQFIA